MKYLLVLLAIVSALHARLGETREKLVARLGKVRLESKHFVTAQGQIVPLGPALFFEKDQWHMQCDMVNGRCAKITYTKKGEWTEEQILTLIQNNAQSHVWTEARDSTKMIRKWNRADSGTARWQFTGAMEFISSDYVRAKSELESALKSKAQQKPNL